MEHLAEAIPHGSYLNRDRLIYLSHPDVETCRSLSEEFISRGFQISVVPELLSVAKLTGMRRPDLVILPLCDANGDPSGALAALDEIRSQHLGIHAFLLAPEGTRAEPVVQAMKRGASYVFSPPYRADSLVGAAQDLFFADIHVQPGKEGHDAITVRGFGTLTHRERQILQFVVEGLTNKEIAVDLGLSYRTVEVHRRHIMEKTGARNTAELVRLAIES